VKELRLPPVKIHCSVLAEDAIRAAIGDVRVFVDPKSFIYLHGMVLDYQETLMQQGFVFVNPNSTKSCGCGTSFSA
jgi:iron-sulfur cluster assembly accessory protein